MAKERIVSLDVLRGISLMMMILVNNPGSWKHIFPPLAHAKWHGCTITDLVFPSFIFVMGAAIPMAMVAKSLDKEAFIKILARSLRIICLGLFLGFFDRIVVFNLDGFSLFSVRFIISVVIAYLLLANFSNKVKLIIALLLFSIFLIIAYGNFENYKEIEIPGVLQRIGVVYFFISLLYLTTTTRIQIIIAGALLLLYWAAMTLIPVPGVGPANLELGTNLAGWVDNFFLAGHLEGQRTWNPEGVFSTIPAIVTGLIGVIIGKIVYDLSIVNLDKVKRMTIIGMVMVIVGLLWNEVFPMNKKLWTSSYVLFAAGLATLMLALCYYLIDVLPSRKWITPFLFWGVNPMIVFYFSYLYPDEVPMTGIVSASDNPKWKDYIFEFYLSPPFTDPRVPSLIWALLNIAVWFFILYVFYKKRWFFKV